MFLFLHSYFIYIYKAIQSNFIARVREVMCEGDS